MPTALVTGASSGIGREIARELAREGFDLVLTARTEPRLRELAAELETRRRVQVRVVPLDLARPGAPGELFEALRDTRVELLVNNAGLGDYGAFAACDQTRLNDLLQVNIAALTQLTRLFLPLMLERGRGRILNVASTAAFFPGPLMSAYYASKAYVLAFSEALANELKGTGVTVTCLCPGPTASEFHQRAGMGGSRLLDGYFMPAWRVARRGVLGALRGRMVVVPGLINQAMVELPRLLPRRVMTDLVRRAQAGPGDLEPVPAAPPPPIPCQSAPAGRPLALVTGASSGIGLELAREFARRGYDLAVVARREERLRALAAELETAVSVTVIPLDLADVDAVRRLRAALGARRVDVLVNNAGFGDLTRFATSDPNKMLDMIQVNIVALTLITRAFLPEMLRRGSGRILNVGSMAAFMRGPFIAVYYASKSYVNSFTEALANEVRGTGVSVTCLSPGFTESEFMERATVGYQRPAVRRRATDPTEVARYGVDALLRGEVLAIPFFSDRLTPLGHRIVSRRFVAAVVRRLLEGRVQEREALEAAGAGEP